MATQLVTVFGGSGFLGRRVVRHLRAAGFDVRAASRHPDRGLYLFPSNDSGIARFHADINEDSSVAAAVAGAFAVVNAVSLYLERGKHTFHSVHVKAAERLATFASRGGAERFVHISGIGADARSASPYIRSRGEGEAAVLKGFPSAILIRPAVMFGPGDAFLRPIAKMLRRMPAFPLFGSGETRLQPAYVEDVGEAVVRVLRLPAAHRVYELAGPSIYKYHELLRIVAGGMGRQALLIPFPFALWRAIGYAAEFLPNPPLALNQVDLMERDNVAASDAAGFEALQISPEPIEKILPEILRETEGSDRQPLTRDEQLHTPRIPRSDVGPLALQIGPFLSSRAGGSFAPKATSFSEQLSLGCFSVHGYAHLSYSPATGSLAIVASDHGRSHPCGLTQRIVIASDAPWGATSRFAGVTKRELE